MQSATERWPQWRICWPPVPSLRRRILRVECVVPTSNSCPWYVSQNKGSSTTPIKA